MARVSKEELAAINEYKDVVHTVSREIISHAAPQELTLFRLMSEAYFKDPNHILHARSGKDEMLGAGVTEVVTLLTPAALAVLTEVARFLAGEFKRQGKGDSPDLVNNLVKAVFKKFRPTATGTEDEAPTLTTDQVDHIRQLARDKARLLKLPPLQTNLLVSSLMSSLALSGA